MNKLISRQELDRQYREHYKIIKKAEYEIAEILKKYDLDGSDFEIIIQNIGLCG